MTVQVLMSTYNGERYLRAQLSSIYAQEGVEVDLLVRDDGSADGTCVLLERERQEGHLQWYVGENLKPARSFMDLLSHASGKADLYAFSDQDDVWLPEKLKKAARAIGEVDGPALYFCQTQLVDENLQPLKQVPIRPMLTYGEALIYQFVGGCTMVFNEALRQLAIRYVPEYLRMHDIWIYDIALAVDAKVVFDPIPHILYRQHGGNAVGQTASWRRVWRERFMRLFRGEHIRYRTAVELLRGYGDVMTSPNRALTRCVVDSRRSFRTCCGLVFGRDLWCAPPLIRLTSRLALITRSF